MLTYIVAIKCPRILILSKHLSGWTVRSRPSYLKINITVLVKVKYKMGNCQTQQPVIHE